MKNWKTSYTPHILGVFLLWNMLSCGPSTSRHTAENRRDTATASADVDAPLQAKILASKKVLKKQLREGANRFNEVSEVPKAAFGMEELHATVVEVKDLLWNDGGYLEWENDKFARKIHDIFGIVIPTDSSELYRYVNLFEPCDTTSIYHRNNGIDYNGFFIVKPENLITDFYYLPELIDYQLLYSDLSEKEKGFSKTSYHQEYHTTVEIEKWMELAARNDEYSLESQRKFNRRLILNRHRFLFENDDSCLNWLLEHDPFFLERLVKKFGWTANEKLLHWAVTQTRFNPSNPDDFGSLFWKKNCDGSLKIHANTFKLLQTLYAPSAASEVHFLLEDLQGYMEYMVYTPHPAIMDKQRVEILAHVVYFAEQYKYKRLDNGQRWSHHRMMGRLRFMLDEKERKILEDNHYFGLPNFREWWDAADYDEYYIDGEHNGPWGRDNEPLTEPEWREKVTGKQL
ncbi:hypothetical protein [Parapedobacter pyrenivorans]|nr:hypothetical protein [Parapedobacter pyrenivorans]